MKYDLDNITCDSGDIFIRENANFKHQLSKHRNTYIISTRHKAEVVPLLKLIMSYTETLESWNTEQV